MPHLALIARLYYGVEATSCQAERNFSALALLIGNMRLEAEPEVYPGKCGVQQGHRQAASAPKPVQRGH